MVPSITFVYTALHLLPAVLISFPRPHPHEFGRCIVVGFSLVFLIWIPPLMVILGLYPQFLEMQRMSGERGGALSIFSLIVQALVHVVLAVRWLIRLGPFRWEEYFATVRYRDQPVRIRFDIFTYGIKYRYQWGFIPFNISCMELAAQSWLWYTFELVMVVKDQVPWLRQPLYLYEINVSWLSNLQWQFALFGTSESLYSTPLLRVH